MMSWCLPWMVGPWEEQYWWHGGRDEATFGYGLEVPPNFQMGMPSVFVNELIGIYHIHFYCNLLFRVHFYSDELLFF